MYEANLAIVSLCFETHDGHDADHVELFNVPAVYVAFELKGSPYVQIQAHAVELLLSVTTKSQRRTVYLQEQRVRVLAVVEPYSTFLRAHPLLEHTNAAVLVNNVAGSFAAVIWTSSFRHTPICTGQQSSA